MLLVIALVIGLAALAGFVAYERRRWRGEYPRADAGSSRRSSAPAAPSPGALELRFESLLGATADIVFLFDRSGTYLDCRVRDEKQLVLPREAFLGKRVTEVLPAELGRRVITALERVAATNRAEVIEYELETNGSRIYEALLVPADQGCILSAVRDVTEVRRLPAAAGQLIQRQDEERRRLAQLVHDELSQTIALLTIDLDRLVTTGPSGHRSDELRGLADRTRELAGMAHRLSATLYPSSLATFGLQASLETLCREVTRVHGIAVDFSAERLPTPIPPEVSMCLYRITQEALHNVARHSGASQAAVEVKGEADSIKLHVADSGVGFDASVPFRGIGLLSSRARIAALGGQFVVHTKPGFGTRLGVSVPLGSSPKRGGGGVVGRVA